MCVILPTHDVYQYSVLARGDIGLKYREEYFSISELILGAGRILGYAAVNNSIIETYWNISRRIVEEEQQGKERAVYGEHLLDNLVQQLTHQYGKGFSTRYLRSFRRFYRVVDDFQIWKSRFPNLTWTMSSKHSELKFERQYAGILKRRHRRCGMCVLSIATSLPSTMNATSLSHNCR